MQHHYHTRSLFIVTHEQNEILCNNFGNNIGRIGAAEEEYKGIFT
jgi:hypothetical protein